MASVLDSVDSFLALCQQSGDAAYAALRSLLDRLEDPATRVRARVFLADVQRRFPTKDDCDRCFSSYHFRIEDIFLDQYEGYSLTHLLFTFLFLFCFVLFWTDVCDCMSFVLLLRVMTTRESECASLEFCCCG